MSYSKNTNSYNIFNIIHDRNSLQLAQITVNLNDVQCVQSTVRLNGQQYCRLDHCSIANQRCSIAPLISSWLIMSQQLFRACFRWSLFFIFWRYIKCCKTSQIFRTNNMNTIKDCQTYFNLNLPSELLVKRYNKFLSKLSVINNTYCRF